MSIWISDGGETSDEVHSLKNKLNNQDAQLAAQKTQLIKQAQQLEEFQLSFNDAIHKLNQETQRSLQLENDLRQRTDDYQNQSVSLKNVEMAVSAARETIKAKDLEVKELQILLDTSSRASHQHDVHTAKLERAKATLEARVRELEVEARKQVPLHASVHQRTMLQPRPSSTSEDRIRLLEKDLDEARVTLSQTEATLRSTSQKLSEAQSDVIRIDNEKAAIGKRMSSRISVLTVSLEEKEAELQIIRTQVGDGSREDELIRRIEEDEAKIVALEGSLREAQDSNYLKSQIRSMDIKLAEHVKKVMERDERYIDVVREKEDVLDQLAGARLEIQRLMGIVTEQSNSSKSYSEMNGKDTKVESASTTDGSTIAYIERLLAAVDRLRAERDDLRRDIQFLELESRFTIESLEAKPTAPISTTTDRDATRTIQSRKVVKHSTLVATATAVIIAHLDSRCSRLQDKLVETNDKCVDLQTQLEIKDQLIKEHAVKMSDMETQVKETTFNLQGLCEQRDSIESQLTRHHTQWEEERQRLNRLNQNTINELERHVQELSRTVENVESERNSLALQVTNLTSELQSAQQGLAKAESRYSSLQFQQLSTMSTTEANRALRDQLQEMEMRVARRTEQIGIHQHDIRRLETNIRLQEERMNEMTAEIETLGAQKDAMVEDCADAREARDSALTRVEALEMELELLDSKLDQSDKALVSVVTAFMQSICHAKSIIRMMRENEAKVADELHTARDLHHMLIRTSEEDKRSFATLEQRLCDSDVGIRQMGITLAMSRGEVKSTASALSGLKQEKDRVDDRLKELLMDINKYENRCTSLTAELETSRLKSDQQVLRITELEARTLELHIDIEKRARENETLFNDLSNFRERLKTSLDDTNNSAETTLESIKPSPAQELKALQEQLITTFETIKQLQTRLTSVEMEKEEMASSYIHVKQELEKHVSAVVRSDEAEENLLVLQRKHEDELDRLRSSLQATRVDNEKAQKRVFALESSHQQIQNELAVAHESYKTELAQFNEESDRVKEKLEKDLTALGSELDKRSHELTASLDDVGRLTTNLEQISKDHEQEREKSNQQIYALEAQLQSAEGTLQELKERVDCVTKDLDKSHQELSAMQKERISFQECITNLEAELQRSVSMTRFLESKVKECEETITMLSSERESQHEELLRIEKLSKAAEVNLSLQSAQHRREMAELRKEIDDLQSKPDLATALAELEERNNEMEELLRKKCTEIEENDDKVLEILKDNKKLTAKVESLNRKVQNLQAKLTAAKASIPKPSTAPTTSSVSSKIYSQFSPHASETSSNLSKSMPTVSSATNRAVTAGSIIRSNTPEVSCAHPIVFKTKSPDQRISSVSAPVEEMDQVIGKKRRAPEDFDSLPPQGFTADSVPDDHNENRTPRVRRMRSGGLTGFTPVRRTHTSQQSPKRTSSALTKTSSLIADVTNSPRGTAQGSGKGSKRSWLGKIRGAPHS